MKVGQQVVCVETSSKIGLYGLMGGRVMEGKIYTIKSFRQDENDGYGITVYLEEMRDDESDRIRYFVPLQEWRESEKAVEELLQQQQTVEI